ncbi:MAG: outer membrane lipoprotein-sorting protein [Deltaproteobacteria bacterium]|nr:outer membrane lipoprotein-sorting protein [Deltaproteobacteria bacterium]
MNRYLLPKIMFILMLSERAFSQTVSPQELLRKVDDLYRSKGSQGQIEMELITPDWSRTLKMDMWTRGMDYTFVRIREPRKDKGVSSLKRQNDMWNFFPKINKVIKVPPSMMMGSWMGSDFTNDDLVRNSSLVRDYVIVSSSNEGDHVSIVLKPQEQTVSVWGKIRIVISQKNQIPLQQEFYDERDQKMRILYFKDVRQFGNRIIPATMELEPLNQKGHKTIIRYVSAQFDTDVPESTFTLTNLQKRR